jgi:hypothetical protein
MIGAEINPTVAELCIGFLTNFVETVLVLTECVRQSFTCVKVFVGLVPACSYEGAKKEKK